ncbi:PA14 domain-containing protein [uncultured Tenacibaculum sp.]|uniref:PA14 domain-containing protein n=1 Tax=uncultured Tenacibaculum sp. TaxID=174713 RepID=UPI00261452CE|nr:PA14 domain-containing protein [uncultured Tenacibaculum sp.]
MKKLTFVYLVFFTTIINAQVFPGVPVSGLPSGTTAQIIATPSPVEGVMAYSTDQRIIYYYNGTNWVSTSGANWLLNGNAGTTNTNFLGTTDDVRMQIRSNNLPLLEFGRRATLGLVQGFPDYTDGDQALVHLNGNGNVAALQFAASGASFYRPMFFTTPNGSFRLKGSSGVTDLFEIGSGGPSNDGRLEFIIGDDGAEPIIFKRYDFRRGQFHKELFRVQGSNNTADAKTRFGINLNTNEIPVDNDYDDSQAGFNIANSTFQVVGSVSKSIETVTGNLTLTEDHHTLIVVNNATITLPAANTCNGRIYVVKNISGSTITISNYLDQTNNNSTTIGAINLWLQSDGTNWQQINSSPTSTSTTNNSGLQYYTWNIANTSQPNINNKRTLGISTTQGATTALLDNTSRGNLAPDNDGYIIHFIGTLNVQNTGDFTFNARSDDGTRIYIDNVLVVENWFDQGATTRSGTVNLATGEHRIEFWYYENAGGDFMQFTWGANPDGYAVGSTINANQFIIK